MGSSWLFGARWMTQSPLAKKRFAPYISWERTPAGRSRVSYRWHYQGRILKVSPRCAHLRTSGGKGHRPCFKFWNPRQIHAFAVVRAIRSADSEGSIRTCRPEYVSGLDAFLRNRVLRQHSEEFYPTLQIGLNALGDLGSISIPSLLYYFQREPFSPWVRDAFCRVGEPAVGHLRHFTGVFSNSQKREYAKRIIAAIKKSATTAG